MPDGDHEIAAEEHHQFAGFHDLVRRGRRLVLDVADCFQHQEQRVVVAFQLGPLMCLQRVLDGQFVQAEGVRDALDLVGIGLVQTDPDETRVPLAHLADRLGVRPAPGQPLAVDIHRAIDDIRRQRHRDRPVEIGLGPVVAATAKAAKRGMAGMGSPGQASWNTKTTARRTAGSVRRHREFPDAGLPGARKGGRRGGNARTTRERTITTAHERSLTSFRPGHVGTCDVAGSR